MSEEEKKPTVYANNDFINVAMDAWCEHYKPAAADEEHDTKTMFEILEALDSVYGMSGSFEGQEVLSELKSRGYQMSYDPASNQFKIMVKN